LDPVEKAQNRQRSGGQGGGGDQIGRNERGRDEIDEGEC